MNPVVHFEIPYEDRDRIMRFYRSAFGWKAQVLGENMGRYVLATTAESDAKPGAPAGAINGGFFPKKPDWPGKEGEMKFLCVICAEKVMEHMSEDDATTHFREYAEFTDGIKQSGHFIGGNRLKPAATAITVRVRNGKVSTTDGPFAETKEQFGGYYLIEAQDLDDAITIATKIPGAQRGCVEIREVAEDPQTRALGLDTPYPRGGAAMKNKVVMFEIPASDFTKAKAFYEAVFDWKVELWGDQGAMALTTAADKEYNPIELGGINGGFYKREAKDDHPSFGVETASIDQTLKAIEKGGGKVVTPKHAIGEWGFMADFADPEGNVITLWEKAKK